MDETIDNSAKNAPVLQEKPDKPKKPSKPVNWMMVLLSLILVALLLMAGGLFYMARQIGHLNSALTIGTQSNAGGTQPAGYTVDQNRGTLISKGQYKVGKSVSRFGFKVTVDSISFSPTDTKVYVTVQNEDTTNIEFMANENSALVDNQHNTYNVNPFNGENQFNGTIPPSGKMTGFLDYEPVKSSAKSLTLNIPHVFDQKHPSWNVTIPFNIPGK